MKLNYRLLIVLGILSLTEITFAQSQKFEWAKTFGGKTSEQVFSITTDASGNVYSTGIFNDTCDFDPGTGIYNLYAYGSDNIFIQKLDSNGNFIWAKSVGGSGRDMGIGIKTDLNDNVYVTGLFAGMVDFDPNAGIQNITSYGNSDVFLLKLDKNGNLKWALGFGGTTTDQGRALDVDESGNIYVAGLFLGTVDFNPGTGVNSKTSAGSYDGFVVKFDSLGIFKWVHQIGRTGYDGASSIACDNNGFVYSTGRSTLVNASLFVDKLDTNGTPQWIKYVGAPSGIVTGNGVATDGQGNSYSTGYFTSTADFDPDRNGTFNLTSNGFNDAFILKLKPNGDFSWAKSFGGNQNDEGKSICVDKAGFVYSTGRYSNSVDFNPNSGSYTLNSKAGSDDAFIQILDTVGIFVDAKSIGGANGKDDAYTIINDGYGNIYSAGYFSDTSDLNPSKLLQIEVSKGMNDGFVLKFSDCTSDSSVDIKSVCDSLQWIDGKTYTTNTTSPTYLLKNSSGCDSIVTLNLDVKTSSNFTYHHTACDSYKWINGTTYNTSTNSGRHTITNTAGCDSVITLDLVINNSPSNLDVQVACDTFTWINGKTYTTSNTTDTQIFQTSAGCDSVITLDLTINKSTAGVDIQSACNSFTWLNGTTYTSNNSTDSYTLQTAAGCDSVVTLNLTIDTVNKTVINSNGQLTAEATNATYQWVNCDKDNAPIAGETARSFTAISNGNYAVVIKEGSCTDTSKCFSISTLRISENDFSSNRPIVKIHPNPTTGRVNFQMVYTRPVSIKIYSTNGQLVSSFFNDNSSEFNYDLSENLPGVYIIEVRDIKGASRYKVIKR